MTSAARPSIDEAIRDFLESLAARSPNTEATYSTGLNKLREYLTVKRRGQSALDPASATTAELPANLLEGFYLWLTRGGDRARARPGGRTRGARTSQASVATYTSAASAWVRFLDRRRLLPEGESYERMHGDLSAVKGRQNYRTPRIDDRVVLLLEAADTAVAREVPPWFTSGAKPPEGTQSPDTGLRQKWLELLRDRAVLHTLFSSALRREEAASLNRGDLQDGRARRAIITGKGSKERVAFFGPEALQSVREYLTARGDTYEPLFLRHDRARGQAGPNGQNWRVSSHGVWDVVRRWSRVAGVRATTHHLRHAKATILLNEGAKLEEVQDLLGHASPQTTKLIYAHYKIEHLEDAFEKYSPSTGKLLSRLRAHDDTEPEQPQE